MDNLMFMIAGIAFIILALQLLKSYLTPSIEEKPPICKVHAWLYKEDIQDYYCTECKRTTSDLMKELDVNRYY